MAIITFSDLASITGGNIRGLAENRPVTYLLTDSRKAMPFEGSVFFAISGTRNDGHKFLEEVYEKGIRQFVVERIDPGYERLADCNILQVNSSLTALQQIVTHHRASLNVPVIGITGSNGKTVIKEWLYTLLSPDYTIAKNPGSYNSQLGVPLSVWQMKEYHQLGIFEAGISKPGEMIRLAAVIRPTIGIFSNLGSSHDEGFSDRSEKLREKLLLFQSCEVVIYCRDHEMVHQEMRRSGFKTLTWGTSSDADMKVLHSGDSIRIRWQNRQFSLAFPLRDVASIENGLHCIATMLYLGFGPEKISARMTGLRSVPMRLELKEGINQCQLIDDTYNNDLAGLQISLDFLAGQQQKKKKTLILSDLLETGMDDATLASAVGRLVSAAKLFRFVGVGRIFSAHRELFPRNSSFFESTDSFLSQFDFATFQNEVILVKGARAFAFEKIVARLQQKVHGTVMEIDLGAVVDNLNYFRSRLSQGTKVMVMVKAFAYGSGSTGISNVLQYHRVDYLGVAYADEGIELRKNNITLPIMVMNPAEDTFDALLTHGLEPEIYSFRILKLFLQFLAGRSARVHLKLDTGMHRLGFEERDIPALSEALTKNPHVRVASIFSHLAGADEPAHDEFSRRQAEKFKTMAERLSQPLGYRPILHLLNSPGILRMPELQFDMVRLGIGLYGVDPTTQNFAALRPVATLKTIISQIKHIEAGETIGYGRRGIAEKPLTLATIAIGYADGFSRSFSRGVGEVVIRGQRARVVGNVCMDMTMVDITGIPAEEGDEVIVYGKENPIHVLAARINTIPYEILTSTSERVKRVFVAESI